VKELTCIAPACYGAPLIKIDLESTWTLERCYCANPNCGRIYAVHTTVGKIIQIAPLALIASLALTILAGEFDHAVEVAVDALG
jgi:hypothetical protein